MPEVGDVFQEVFFVEAKPPEAHDIAAAQAEAVNHHPPQALSRRYKHPQPECVAHILSCQHQYWHLRQGLTAATSSADQNSLNKGTQAAF